MNETVIIAIISLIGTLAGTFSGIVVSGKLTTYRIEQLEKKVEKHNTIVERTYRLEEQAALTDEKLKVANHRIDDLENRRGS